MKKGLIAILLVLAISSMAWGEGDGTVAYWSFDEGEEIIVYDEVGENHGILKADKDGEIPIWTRGISGNALMFTPGSKGYVEIPPDKSIKPEDSLTVMAWIKTNTSRGKGEIICTKADTSLTGYRFFQEWGKLSFEISEGQEHYRLTAGTLPVNVWCHVVATFDGKQMKVYINGDQVGVKELPSNAKIAYGVHAVMIGNYVGRKDAYPFDGVIDEVRIFNRALEEKEILTYSEIK